MSVPPTPPLKSSQRLSAPTRGVATVRAVEEFAEPGLFSGPSMRRATRPIVPSDDPRRLVQGAVQQAAAEGTDRPILDRGRPRIGVPSIPRRQDSTRSPPGTRTPVDITWEDGFSYIDHDEASGVPLSLGPLRSSAPRKSAATTPSPLDQRRQRAGSFESGKPRGLSFHDAREFMRSGRGLRPGSWHEAPIKAGTHSGTDAEHGDRRASRSRSQSPHDGRSRSLSPSVQSRAPRDEDRFTEVSLDGSQLRPLASHPPSPDEHPQLLLADGTSQSTVPDNVPPSPERSNDLSMQSTRWQTSIRRHLGATLGEFLGTTSFLFTAFGGVIAAASNSPEPSIAANSLSLIGFNVSRLIYMSLAFGFSYMVNVWIFFHVSEGLFNPAVTMALFITGSQGIVRSLLLLIAQLTGSVAASALTLGVFQTLIPARTAPADGVSIPRGLFIEAIMTAQLVLVILLFAQEKHRATVAAPVVIGLALFGSELVAIFWTGGSLNPARSFGPNVVSWVWTSTHWIYWAGPLMGSVIAVIILRALQAIGSELRPDEEHFSAHLSPPCQHHSMFVQRDDFMRHGTKGIRFDMDHGGVPQHVDSDLTGVINLWQTRPGVGRFRGNSLAHGHQAPQIGRSDVES